MPMKLIAARPKNSFGLFIRMLAAPLRINIGARIRSARAFRKKTISSTGTKADDSRMQIPITVNINIASNIISAACNAGESDVNLAITSMLVSVESWAD
jgi:hypothetical protein